MRDHFALLTLEIELGQRIWAMRARFRALQHVEEGVPNQRHQEGGHVVLVVFADLSTAMSRTQHRGHKIPRGRSIKISVQNLKIWPQIEVIGPRIESRESSKVIRPQFVC